MLNDWDLSLFNWRTTPYLRGDFWEITKIIYRHLKKFSKDIGSVSFQPNLAQSILGWKGYRFVRLNHHALIIREGGNTDFISTCIIFFACSSMLNIMKCFSIQRWGPWASCWNIDMGIQETVLLRWAEYLIIWVSVGES